MTIVERPRERLASLDLFRGAIMFLLVAESARLYGGIREAFVVDGQPYWLAKVLEQFEHHEWNGLRFWDLIQPGFMFIVGVAMAFSLERRLAEGASWGRTFVHILYRCAMLFLFGVMLHCGYAGKLVFELWNVLTQLSFTVLVAFLLYRLPVSVQLLASFACLGLTEVLYRYTNVEGFSEPFVDQKNFGNYVDLLIMGKINGGGWVAINALPTAAHTIWGALVGKLLMSHRSAGLKVAILVVAGLLGLAIGYGMDHFEITPIIKRIATTSFVIVSAGWCLLFLAVAYVIVDVFGFKRWTVFFAVVGMSPIFIYLLMQVFGGRIREYLGIFSHGAIEWLGIDPKYDLLAMAVLVQAFAWFLCYWLYKRRIVVKI